MDAPASTLPSTPHPTSRLGTPRLEALSDGVFSIVMTLMVFDIKPPGVPAAELPGALAALWPHFLSYVISFALLGCYWMGHRSQYGYIERADHTLNWLGMWFLAPVTLVPFSAQLLARHPFDSRVIALYGANLILIGLFLYAHWRHAGRAGLFSQGVTPLVYRFAVSRCLLAPACYLVAIVLGLFVPQAALVVFAAVPVLYIAPPLQGFWMRLAAPRA